MANQDNLPVYPRVSRSSEIDSDYDHILRLLATAGENGLTTKEIGEVVLPKAEDLKRATQFKMSKLRSRLDNDEKSKKTVIKKEVWILVDKDENSDNK